MTMPNLSDRLQELQKQSGILKKDIAQAVGLSIMGYYRYERGEREPSMSTLIALADFFDVSLDYLVGRSDELERR
jgi:transcriptional regulator with XRE-family HTH domain